MSRFLTLRLIFMAAKAWPLEKAVPKPLAGPAADLLAAAGDAVVEVVVEKLQSPFEAYQETFRATLSARRLDRDVSRPVNLIAFEVRFSITSCRFGTSPTQHMSPIDARSATLTSSRRVM